MPSGCWREILDGIEREHQAISIDSLQSKIAASTACHAAIKVNMPLDQTKMEWLLAELAKTECAHELPARPPDCAALFAARNRERVQARLIEAKRTLPQQRVLVHITRDD